jgi:hypothetical protein
MSTVHSPSLRYGATGSPTSEVPPPRGEKTPRTRYLLARWMPALAVVGRFVLRIHL